MGGETVGLAAKKGFSCPKFRLPLAPFFDTSYIYFEPAPYLISWGIIINLFTFNRFITNGQTK